MKYHIPNFKGPLSYYIVYNIPLYACKINVTLYDTKLIMPIILRFFKIIQYAVFKYVRVPFKILKSDWLTRRKIVHVYI